METPGIPDPSTIDHSQDSTPGYIEPNIVEVEEAETEYAKAQRQTFEQIIGIKADTINDPDHPFLYCMCPKNDHAAMRRLYDKGWRPDPAEVEALGRENFLRLRIPKKIHAAAYREAVIRNHEQAGDKIKQVDFKAPDRDDTITKVDEIADSSKFVREMIDKLPDQVDDIDES